MHNIKRYVLSLAYYIQLAMSMSSRSTLFSHGNHFEWSCQHTPVCMCVYVLFSSSFSFRACNGTFNGGTETSCKESGGEKSNRRRGRHQYYCCCCCSCFAFMHLLFQSVCPGKMIFSVLFRICWSVPLMIIA